MAAVKNLMCGDLVIAQLGSNDINDNMDTLTVVDLRHGY
jgi:hypothetical protein